jgi:hypothetical protein
MDWKDVAGGVAKAAPLLGGILGGPVGGAIGGVISLIANAFGLTPEETTPDKINQLLQVDPQAALKLAEIEANNKLELQRISLELTRIELQDTASARQREIEVVKATGSKDVNLYILAWTVILFFYALVAILCFQIVPDANMGPVNQLFGAMAAGFGMVLAYFFGSSRGSAMKSRAMEDLAKQNGK